MAALIFQQKCLFLQKLVFPQPFPLTLSYNSELKPILDQIQSQKPVSATHLPGFPKQLHSYFLHVSLVYKTTEDAIHQGFLHALPKYSQRKMTVPSFQKMMYNKNPMSNHGSKFVSHFKSKLEFFRPSVKKFSFSCMLITEPPKG